MVQKDPKIATIMKMLPDTMPVFHRAARKGQGVQEGQREEA